MPSEVLTPLSSSIFIKANCMISNLKLYFSLLIAFLFFLMSCHEKGTNQINKKAFKEEVKSRELKRVSNAEISNAAYEQGISIVKAAEKILFSAVHNALAQNDSLAAAIEFYRLAHHTVKDSLALEYNAIINRVSLKNTSKTNEPNELERILLDAYLYNVENKLPLEDNIQEIDKSYFLYTQPIMINSIECLRCHGEIGKDVSNEDYQTLKKYYPNDKAFGYKLHDFRGIWSIKLSKKELIKGL